MTIINKIEFIIDHIDPLGQGVFKKDDQIYFIPKTLPGETGVAEVLKRKKGVHFCKVIELYKESVKRVTPSCPHYQVCNGCHYQHTDYEHEIELKLASFQRMLAPIDTSAPIEAIAAEDRTEYRNRIQLHYHKKAGVLGFKDSKNKIIDVRDCLISEPNIQKEVQKLYKDNKWMDLCPKEISGHVEVYNSPTGLKTTWNKSYASGGFTQVNKKMNDKLVNLLNLNLQETNIESLLDLFGGAGNLSDKYPLYRSVVDIYSSEMPKEFTSLNLHSDHSLNEFIQKTDKSFDTFIIDPPRSGFPALSQWSNHYKPKNIHYISCHPQTMIRDLRALLAENKYKIVHIYLIDLFPNTFHFEAYISLSKC
jgi:23S rRNA (uracil1939-C5)-methyltransferase